MSIEVRLLSSDTALFYDLARQHGGLFVQSFWCSAYSTSLKIAGIFNNGSLIGGFTLFETRLKGFKAWITPPFAQHCGLFYQTSTSDNTSKINSFHKSVMREVAGFLKSEGPSLIKLEWPPEVTDTQPLIWQGLDISPKYTYVIDLTRGEDELRKNADPKIRGLLEPRGLLLKSDTDPSTLMQLVKKTYAGKSVSINTMLAQLLVSSVHQHGQLLSSLVTVNGEAVGAYVCAYYGDTCYYLFGYTAPDSEKNAGHAGIWHCVGQAREKGLSKFDFEGSMLPGVEHFFRSFGGAQVPYFGLIGGKKIVRLLYRMKRRS